MPANFYFDDIDPEIAAAVRNVADALGKAGARIIDVTVPDAERAHHYATTIVLADACDVHAEALDTRRDAFSPQVYERMSRGRGFSAVDYARRNGSARHGAAISASCLRRCDVLLFPTTPFTAPLIEDGAHLADATRHATRFAYGGGLAGLPGLSLPCGITKAGLPIGALLEAAWFNEAALLRAGRAWQRITDWHLRRPPAANCVDDRDARRRPDHTRPDDRNNEGVSMPINKTVLACCRRYRGLCVDRRLTCRHA